MSLADIMGMFRSSAPAVNPPPGQNPADAGKPIPGTQTTAQTAPNGVVPAQVQDTKQAEPGSPLDAHKDIWQTPATTNNPEPGGVFANLDPQKVMESARKVDFTKSISPELLAKIQAGGAEAAQAFAQSMNSVAQTVYAQSAMATSKIVEQALEQQQEKFNAQLPQMFKSLSANEGLVASSPLLSNPAVQPLVGALKEQLIRKNPNATSSEIQTQVADYFAALGQSFAPKPQAQAGRGAKKDDFDWEKFLG